MGSAFHSLGRYQDAANAYEEGLKLDPNNAQMKESLADVKDRLADSSFTGGLPNMFSSPDVLIKLRNDPRTRAFMNDPTYVQMIEKIQKDRKCLQYVS